MNKTLLIIIGFLCAMATALYLSRMNCSYNISRPIKQSCTEDLIIYFDNVAGLKEGDAVMFEGYEIGKVAEIRVMPNNFAIVAGLNNRIKLHKNSKATITPSSLLGGQYLVITRGDGDELQSGETLNGEATPDLSIDPEIINEFLKSFTKDKQSLDKDNNRKENK